MPLSRWAQEQVDADISRLWAAFKAGSISCGEESPSKVDFMQHMKENEPTLAIYIEAEKLL